MYFFTLTLKLGHFIKFKFLSTFYFGRHIGCFLAGWIRSFCLRFERNKIVEVTLYNPRSIVNCLMNLEKQIDTPLQASWYGSGNTEIVENSFSKLSSHEVLSSLIEEGVKFDFIDYKRMYFRPDNKDPNIFIELLLHTGYLAWRDRTTLIVPNHEAKLFFYHNIINLITL